MNRRTLLQSLIAGITWLLGWRPDPHRVLSEPSDLWWDDWPASIGPPEYDIASPMLLNCTLVKNISGDELKPGQVVCWGKDVEPIE